MATINQIRANRSNAKHSTGPKTSAGQDRVRFNALVHGLRAESAVSPGEDQPKFDQLLERLSAAWMPQDDMEKSLVEQNRRQSVEIGPHRPLRGRSEEH